MTQPTRAPRHPPPVGGQRGAPQTLNEIGAVGSQTQGTGSSTPEERGGADEGAMTKCMKVATTDELEAHQCKLVEVEGQKRALFRVGEVFHALSDTCTHRGGPLCEGTVEGAEVTCPWHGAKFDIKTGAVMGPPAGREVRSYSVRVTGADVEIEV